MWTVAESRPSSFVTVTTCWHGERMERPERGRSEEYEAHEGCNFVRTTRLAPFWAAASLKMDVRGGERMRQTALAEAVTVLELSSSPVVLPSVQSHRTQQRGCSEKSALARSSSTSSI